MHYITYPEHPCVPDLGAAAGGILSRKGSNIFEYTFTDINDFRKTWNKYIEILGACGFKFRKRIAVEDSLYFKLKLFHPEHGIAIIYSSSADEHISIEIEYIQK